MRFVIQRVMHSKVTINGEVRGQIGKGFMVLIGVGEEDTVEIADKMIHKMVNMRIFEDENGKMYVNPGSRKCTCVSTSPGATTSPSASMTSAPSASRSYPVLTM